MPPLSEMVLPKNRNILSSLYFAFIHRDGRGDKNAAYIGGGARCYAYRKSQKRRANAFVIFAVNGENIISARDAGEAYGKHRIRAGNRSCRNLRVLQKRYRAFGIRSAEKGNAGRRGNNSASAASAASSSAAASASARISGARSRTSSRA